jgi:hypothetical protein
MRQNARRKGWRKNLCRWSPQTKHEALALLDRVVRHVRKHFNYIPPPIKSQWADLPKPLSTVAMLERLIEELQGTLVSVTKNGRYIGKSGWRPLSCTKPRRQKTLRPEVLTTPEKPKRKSQFGTAKQLRKAAHRIFREGWLKKKMYVFPYRPHVDVFLKDHKVHVFVNPQNRFDVLDGMMNITIASGITEQAVREMVRW